MKTLAIFDMAGTTINDGDHVYRVLWESVEREGAVFTDEEFQQWMGTEKKWAIRNLFEIGGVPAEDTLVERTFGWFLGELATAYREDPPVPLPGVEDALRSLRAAGTKIALTTGFSRQIADLILGQLRWGTASDNDLLFDAIVCGDEVAAGRPSPDLIVSVMEKVGVIDPENVISAGDTVVDVESAKSAGVTSVGVLTGHLTRADFEEAGADLILESVADLVLESA